MAVNMGQEGLLQGLLLTALVTAALTQDGLTCTNVGETWHHLCNTCSCRAGVTVCTMDRCSSDHGAISARSCLAGSKWKDGCGQTCVCDVSGKTRCTLGSCPPRVGPGRSLTFIKTTGDACAAGDSWTVDCNTCTCVDGVAQCTSERCPPPATQPVDPCEPDERWEDECGNLCHCTELGRPSCTLLRCGVGERAGARRRPIRRSGDSCQNEGERWQQGCNECDCTSGVVSCTRRLCAVAQQPEKYGECQPGTRWVDECDNTCHCTAAGMPFCTLNECPHGRQEGVRVHFLLEEGSTCTNEGEPWEQGCSTCECRSGRVSCTERACPHTYSERVGGAAEPEWMRCADGTTWEDECGNICSCWAQQPLCTRMGCPKGRIAGKPVKFFMFDGDACANEGVSWKDDCNTCACTNGVVSCTKQFCPKQRQSVRLVTPFMAATCTPGKRWVDECDNVCFCPPSGHSACTMMACPPGKRPMVPVRYIHAEGDACSEEGASWRHECNTCRCRGGQVTCTKRPCPGMVRPVLRLGVSPLGLGPGSDKQCEEGTDYTDECDNHCRCSSGGLLVCTLKLCAPGKQAGKPQKKAPKLGEPCSADVGETWLHECNTCQCVDGVTACSRVVCRRREQALDGVPVQQCRPGSSWLDECENHCSCSAHGTSYCTLKACDYGLQYGVPKMYLQSINDTCQQEGGTWKQDCNTCTCTDGRVACTQEICKEEPTGVRARFSFARERCVPGSKWTDECGNTCRCSSTRQPACSLKSCPPGKKAGVAVEQLPKEGDSCSTEGKTWKEDCSKCTCIDSVVICTDQLCTSASDEGPCSEGEMWIDECSNRCKCVSGEPRCTQRPCPQGGRPGVPVRFIVPDGDECDNEEEQWRDDCNTCRCLRGRVVCTKDKCVGFERGGGQKKLGNCPYVPPGTLGICINGCNGDDMCPDDQKCCSNGCGALCMKPDSCLEGIVWKEECNTCECTNGVPACTKKLCHKTGDPADPPSAEQSPASGTCLEGSVWKKDCNICDCIFGKEVCTRKLCPPNVSPIDEVTGECREDSVWTKGCNRCRCIDGRAICTLKPCKPGDNAGDGLHTGADEEICRLPPFDLAKDPCPGFIRRWTFNYAKSRCQRYVYGGCHGTANLFRTKKACKRRCMKKVSKRDASACHQPVDSGTCFDVIPRYYFDRGANKCRQFGYSGCGGNTNNFETLASCIGICGGTYTSEDTTCDRSRCPWSYFKHYIEQGCQPVYDKQGCCPASFDCPAEARPQEAVTEPCMYRGQQYNDGDRVEAASRLDPCKRDCLCVSSLEAGPSIECAEVDCPASVWNQISAGCVPLYLPNRCCPVSVSCPRSRRRRSAELSHHGEQLRPDPTCHVDGRTYVAGELMPIRGDPCTTCVCSPEYSGPDGPGCRRTECLNFTAGFSKRDCVPVYETGICCPVDWKCAEDVLFKSSPPALSLSGSNALSTVCGLPKKRGPCVQSLERFFFDRELQQCVQFTYGGCLGNGNNFRTLAECSFACRGEGSGSQTLVSAATIGGSTCALPTAPGSCGERLLRFSFDARRGGCVSFEYTGCGGNANRFSSLERCRSACEPTEQQGLCYSNERRFFFDVGTGSCQSFTYSGCGGNDNNFATAEQCYNKCHPGSADSKRRIQKLLQMCLAPADPGPCRSWRVRYHFSTSTASCQPFRFGGCLGNSNSFASKQECSAVCGEIAQHLRASSSENQCLFGGRAVRRGTMVDVQEKCTVCECLAPPKLTCRKLRCPQIPEGLEPFCHYSLLEPGDCCPEMICDASVDILPNLSPECGHEQCHLPEAREGCSVVYKSRECCPQVHCSHPTNVNTRLLGLEAVYECEQTECPASCGISRDIYGCVVCDCDDIFQPALRMALSGAISDTRLTARMAPPQPRCQRQFCPRGCPSFYGDDGCIVCECESVTSAVPPTTPPTTTRRPCPMVTCRPGCGYKQDRRGCTVCDCRELTTVPPSPCPPLQCEPGCRAESVAGNCPQCRCPGLVDLLLAETRHCPEMQCPPHCLLAAEAGGCARCDCPDLAPPVCPPCPCRSPLSSAPAGWPSLASLSSDCPPLECPPRCDVRLDGRGCPQCSCVGAGQPGCARVTCPPGCRTEADPVSGCPSCQCDICPPCECAAEQGRSCPSALCPAHCRRLLRDGCYQCACDQPPAGSRDG